MSRGGSFGGGKSSLGYLFESSGEETAKPPSGEDAGEKSMPIPSHSAAAAADKIQATSNNYSRPQGQNSGNFITGRPSTKVQSVPGGSSSLGYLFGEHKQG
ncbi:protein SPIRAL1-like 5 [Curcuma longa]|uniref:protein SPIRAL1-like 5 n=1 Tax=Curcuma longa TaxID=136217 RepID=UPI003D9EDC93